MIKEQIRKILRKILINYPNRCKLKNQKPSIIASNCNGGIIYHDLGIKFYSPTINLFFYPKDYIKFISNLKYYLSLSITPPDKNTNVSLKNTYPIGLLGDIEIHFLHYKSLEEATMKWKERSKRVNYDNLFFIMTDRDGCTYKDIERFNKLPYKNKVIFTSKLYPEFKSAFFIKDFYDKKEVGILSSFKRKSIKRYIDYFDYVTFLNNIYK